MRPAHPLKGLFLVPALPALFLALAGFVLAGSRAAQKPDAPAPTAPKSTATSKRKVIKTKGRQSMSGTDPYMKSRVVTSTQESATSLAGNKVRVKAGATMAGACTVHIDNWTNAIVNIFLGGDYTGTVGPGGALDATIPNGPSLFYARIDLDQFSWIPLGPENIDCDGNYSFTITP
jgi:hypothetical protein